MAGGPGGIETPTSLALLFHPATWYDMLLGFILTLPQYLSQKQQVKETIDRHPSNPEWWHILPALSGFLGDSVTLMENWLKDLEHIFFFWLK